MTQKRQYIYTLRPIPRLLKEENWTAREEEITSRHFNYLKAKLAEGKLILAGKTSGFRRKDIRNSYIRSGILRRSGGVHERRPRRKRRHNAGGAFPV